MVWLIALVCLVVAGAAGHSYGPVRGAAAFFGLVFGVTLAKPLAILTKHLLPVLGLVHPVWGIFVPQTIACVLVMIIFMIAGEVRHQRIAFEFKYKTDDRTRISWDRMYARVGLAIGVLDGVILFLLLMVPVYVGGYFANEAQITESDPFLPRFLVQARAELQSTGLDRVVAAYDPTPPQLYNAGDVATLVLHNPLSEARLTHYPALLQLAEQPEFKTFGSDIAFQELIQTQAKPSQILAYPSVINILTNAGLTAELSSLIGNNLDDLKEFLMTGQSPKFDAEPILGIWDSDRAGTMAEVRRRQPGLTPLQMKEKEQDVYPILEGLSLTAIPNGQMLLKKATANNPYTTIVGAWKRQDSGYQVTLPGSHPEQSDVSIEEGNKLLLPKDGFFLVFNKEL